VVLGIASSLGIAVPAHADPSVDASYVDALTRAGITFADSSTAVNAGESACGLMEQGKPVLDIVAAVTQQNPGISTTSAAQFTAIAASAYCPQYIQQVSNGGTGGRRE
jgi:antitoxin (DNA-binding transcriptional repressor) of toxin-antitoxin stability system